MYLKLPVFEFTLESREKGELMALNDKKTSFIDDNPDNYDKSAILEKISWRNRNYIEILPLEFCNVNSTLLITVNSKKKIGMGWDLEYIVNEVRYRSFNNYLFNKFSNLFSNISFKSNPKLSKWVNYKSFTQKRLRRQCINGIPPEIRGEVWCYLLGSDQMLKSHPNVYLKELNGNINKSIENQINLDLHRTFPNSKYYSNSIKFDEFGTLSRVLNAFASYDKVIGYCQSMNFIVAILLINMKEEVAFWSLVQIASKNRNKALMASSWGDLERYYGERMDGILRDIIVLESLCEELIPEVSLKLKNTGINFQWFALEWFLCFFVTSLPLISVMEILDFIFCFGSDTIFSISLALLDLNRKMILSSVSMEECMNILKNIAKNVTNPSDLIRKAINYNICKSKIQKLRDKN